jgi:hypothetical protein
MEKSAAEAVAIAAKSSGSSSDGGEHGVSVATKQTYTLKMDLRLIPILGCTYTILFLDRTNSTLK